MYKIGEFSKITKVSARMLRYYDKENILKPSFIGNNGYRFYTDSNIEVISKIKTLRRYYFSYEEIKYILARKQEHNPEVYRNKLQELKMSASKYNLLISELEDKNKINNRNKIINKYDINVCQKLAYNAFCNRSIINNNEMDIFIESSFNKIKNRKTQIVGSYYIMFYDNEELDEGICEVEYYQPVVNYEEIKGFEVKHIESSMYISTVHYGRYDGLDNAYRALYKWSKNNDFIITGNFIEKYYVDASLTISNDEFITEVSVEILKK